jgi:hypothetical protein
VTAPSIGDRLSEVAATQGRWPGPDSFFGLDQLILLVTPFPILLIADVAWILGLDNNAADAIRAVYITPLFFVTMASFFGIPIVGTALLLFLIGFNVYFRRVKRLVPYAVVLIGLPALMEMTDSDYLRFRLQEARFQVAEQQSNAMPERSAYCFVFDQIEDNFYFGGMNFLPYEKLVLYVSPDLAGQETPRIDTIVADGRCPLDKPLKHVRRLKGRFYLANTFER